MNAPLSVADYERLAEERLDATAWAYYVGGAGDEWTLRENVAAFRRHPLRPRVLRDVSSVATATTVLGTEVSMPVLLAPLAFQRMAHPDGEEAAARAAAAADTLMCLSSAATCDPVDLARAAPGGKRWFQVYVFPGRELTIRLVEEAVANDYSALVLTADTPYLGRRERDLRIGFALPDHIKHYGERLGRFDTALTWSDLDWLRGYGLPVVVKGIHTGEDAVLACEHGAAGVVVSNHGARQLDGVAATIDVLEEVVDAVDGRCEVYLDGGVRRGADALRALALGARAVFIGRPFLYGLAAAGEEGVTHVLELLRAEVELGLALLGCRSPAEVVRSHVK